MKVIPRIRGGLGNQLFAYAAARRIALVNNAELVLDNVSGFKYDHTYQQQYHLDRFNIKAALASPQDRFEPFSKVRRYVKRWINRRIPFEKRRYIQQQGNAFDPRLLTIRPRGDLHLEGYWQSERYFQDIEDVIRVDLNIQSPEDNENIQMSENIRSCDAIALHVRFFDSPDIVGGNNATSEYYKKALAAMQERVPTAHYFLFSDDIVAARALIDLSEHQITVVSHNPSDATAYADLWLMTQCKHFIIANSTFSWWGAWLSAYQDKIVIAPGFVIQGSKTAWGFDGLLPDSWIKI
ncbi:alpha-1,2-fucosyltransferase [Alcaligenaceae bacterium LF4-65]|uniref:Alpha-1,2-fucosyltransferase n=1 Tax=Zwartia hollandica TaxID=324606 RepID=A0A953N727_9BURK|nr:alpha-1,2-fucosyltransferase [Zwartia hollandica]MBZ1350117.1 alpha-1,2-fucosyltransferase [Zwartia hollandica]